MPLHFSQTIQSFPLFPKNKNHRVSVFTVNYRNSIRQTGENRERMLTFKNYIPRVNEYQREKTYTFLYQNAPSTST